MKPLPLFIALLVLWTSQLTGRAMIDGRTTDPEWFNGVSGKLLVLEYESPFGGASGQQLAQLIGRMALATVSGLDSFAVITLRQETPPIPLTPKNVEVLARTQRAPVVIWGEFYEQSGRLFVTSHLRHVPDGSTNASGRPMQISWDISRLGVPGISRTSAVVPTSQVNFAPVEVSRASLATLQTLWSKTLVLRNAPLDHADQSGELKPDRPYYVMGASNGWTRLTVRQGGEGWVRLTELSRHDEFKELIGVVWYAQGMLQHLAGKPAAAATTWKSYLGQYGARQDAMNQALARILLGYAYHLDLSSSPAQRSALALQEFGLAAALLPNSASPVNGQALALFGQATRGPVKPEEMKQLEKRLIQVIQTENDLSAVRNLQVLYHLPGAREYFKEATRDFAQDRDKRVGLLRSLEKQFQTSRTE